MRKAAWILGTGLACAVCRAAEAPPDPSVLSAPIVDLSHPYDVQTIFWPTAERFALQTVADGITPGGFYHAANRFSMEEHGGTHADAPRHFAAGRWTVEEIPVDRLRGTAAVVDVSGEASRNTDYQVTVGDLQAWERDHGAIPTSTFQVCIPTRPAGWCVSGA